jgi:hypothetical protein
LRSRFCASQKQREGGVEPPQPVGETVCAPASLNPISRCSGENEKPAQESYAGWQKSLGGGVV